MDCKSVDWINLPKDTIQWWSLVSTALQLRILNKLGLRVCVCTGLT